MEEFKSVFEGYAYVLKRPSLQSVQSSASSPLNVHLLSSLLKVWQSMQ